MSLYGTGRREACLAAGVLAVLAFATQAPALFGWTTAVPRSGEEAVTSSVLLPALADASAVLAEGEWPWWNPFARFGEPFTASGLQPLYIGYWPLLWFGVGILPAVMALHGALAALCMYRFVRALPTSRFVAFLGGGLWGLGWFFQAQLDRFPEAAACAWLPLLLESVWRLTRPGSRRGAGATLAISLGAMVMTGGAAVTRTGLVATAFIAAWNLLRLTRTDRLRAAGSLLAGGAIGALLCAPAWLDALQHGGWLQRPGAALAPLLPLEALAGLLSPTLLSRETLGELGPGLAARDPLSLALFPGTATLLFALLGFVRPSPAQPRWPWLVLALTGLVLTFDVPGAAGLQAGFGLHGARPGAALLLFHLGMLVLACNGLDAFLDAPYRRPAALPLLATATVLLAGAAGAALELQPEIGAATLPGWRGDAPEAVAAAAATARRALLPTSSVLFLLGTMFLLWRRMGVLRFKAALAIVVLAEVATFATLGSVRRAPPASALALAGASARALAIDEPALASLAHSTLRVRGINRSGDAALRRTVAFLDEMAPGSLLAGDRMHGGVPDPAAYSPALAALGQIDVLVGSEAARLGLHLHAPAAPGGAASLPAPRVAWARLLFRAAPAASADDARRLLRTVGQLPEHPVIEADGGFAPREPTMPGRVQVLERRAGSARLQVDAADGRAWLVLADAHAPGWLAAVDGRRTPIVPAYVAFRAIPIPEGQHEVRLEYRPWARRFGIALALAGAVLCLGFVVLEASRAPPRLEQRPPRILRKRPNPA